MSKKILIFFGFSHPILKLYFDCHSNREGLKSLFHYKMLTKLSGFLFVIANVLIPTSLLIFATGFFPHKPFLRGKASFNELEESQTMTAPFDKVIFMVVDALRRSGKCFDV